MPSEWRIDAGRGIPGLCDFESFPAAAAALSVEGFELSVVEEGIGIGKMKSADSSFGYNMLALALVGANKQTNKQRTKQVAPM